MRVKTQTTYAKPPKGKRQNVTTETPSPSPEVGPSKKKSTKSKPFYNSIASVSALKTARAAKEGEDVGDGDQLGPLNPSATLSKDLVLRIIIAKMEGSKQCDWYDLSMKLGWSGEGSATKVNGKKRKEGEALNGNDIRELYYRVGFTL
jgi:hypothetical protein